MSPRTPFLSRLIGLYAILVALSMFSRGQATRGDGSSPSSEPVNGIRPRRSHAGRWVGNGSRAQHLVGWCARGCSHPRRLDDADQELSVFIPASRDGGEAVS